MPAHLLSVDSLSRDAVDHLIRIAERMEPIAQRRKVTRVLEGAVLVLVFLGAILLQQDHADSLARARLTGALFAEARSYYQSIE